MTLVKHNPANLGVIFDELFNGFPTTWGRDVHNAAIPAVNIHETNEAYHVELNAPGRNKEDFKVNLEENILTISYEKNSEKENEGYKTIRKEYSFESFKRSFNLGEEINADNIQAKYENGVLKLYLPKKDEVKETPKQISIQ